MSFIPPHGTALDILPAGQIVTATSDGTGDVTIEVLNLTFNAPARFLEVSRGLAGKTVSAGPYTQDRSIRINSGVRSSSYVMGEADVLYANATRGSSSCLRAAISAYKNGMRSRPPIITGIMDSNGTGEGAGVGGGTAPKLTGAYGRGPIEQIAKVCPTLSGLPLRTTAWFGEGNCNNNAVPVSEYNPRITLGTGWARTTGSTMFALGGSHMVGSANSAGYFTYDFGSRVTNVELYMVVNGTNSAAVGVYNSANTLIATINTNNATPSASRFSVSSNFPDGVVKVKNNGAANCYIAGMIAWDATEQSIILARNSFSAAVVADFSVTTNVWDGMGYYPEMRPDCAIVSLTINDINGGTSRANYNTGLTYIADFVVRYGDLIASTGGNGNGPNYGNGTKEGIEAEAKKVAGVFGAPFVSMHKEWVDWTAENNRGFAYDSNHRTISGYRDQARVYANALRALIEDK